MPLSWYLTDKHPEEIGRNIAIRRGGKHSIAEHQTSGYTPGPPIGYIGFVEIDAESGKEVLPVHFILPDKDRWSLWRLKASAVLDVLVERHDTAEALLAALGEHDNAIDQAIFLVPIPFEEPADTYWIKGWQFAEVNAISAHFYLRYADENDESFSDDISVYADNVIARVCQLDDGMFAVDCLTQDEIKKQALIKQLDYYLIELPKQWTVAKGGSRVIAEYLTHHCSTTANAYGQCRWHTHQVRRHEGSSVEAHTPVIQKTVFGLIGLVGVLVLFFFE